MTTRDERVSSLASDLLVAGSVSATFTTGCKPVTSGLAPAGPRMLTPTRVLAKWCRGPTGATAASAQFLGETDIYFTSRATRNPFAEKRTLLSYLKRVETGM